MLLNKRLGLCLRPLYILHTYCTNQFDFYLCCTLCISLKSWQITCSKNEFSRTESDFQYGKCQEIYILCTYFINMHLTSSCFLTTYPKEKTFIAFLTWYPGMAEKWSGWPILIKPCHRATLTKGANFCWSRNVFEDKFIEQAQIECSGQLLSNLWPIQNHFFLNL